MKMKLLAITIVMGLFSAIFLLSVVVHAGTWSGSGPGTVTVLDGTTSNPQLDYDLKGEACFTRQTWDLHTIADADGEIELYYLYEGFHGWYQVRVFIDAYVTHNSVTTVVPLVNLGPVNCCGYPSGWFGEQGSVRLNVQAGDIYGFRFGGSHYTADPEMSATFVVMRITINVPGTSDPWLAGMPDGSSASLYEPSGEPADFAPYQSPVLVSGIVPRTLLMWSATGKAGYYPGNATGPDGDLGGVVNHSSGAENGISDITAPIVSLVGVFLGSSQPNLTPAPGTLDFSSEASRNYLTLNPALQQVFFMGDGVTDGGIAQTIVVPPGATRLFLGTMDRYGWANNAGSFDVTIAPGASPFFPEEGTIGTEISIVGSDFGANKGKVYLGAVALKVLAWNDEMIQCLITKPLSPSSYDVRIQPKRAAEIVLPNAFSVEAPRIDSIETFQVGQLIQVTIFGDFFGIKKGKVTLGGQKCKVLNWSMDASTGESEILIQVPKGLGSGTYDLTITNQVGSDTKTGIVL